MSDDHYLDGSTNENAQESGSCVSRRYVLGGAAASLPFLAGCSTLIEELDTGTDGSTTTPTPTATETRSTQGLTSPAMIPAPTDPTDVFVQYIDLPVIQSHNLASGPSDIGNTTSYESPLGYTIPHSSLKCLTVVDDITILNGQLPHDEITRSVQQFGLQHRKTHRGYKLYGDPDGRYRNKLALKEDTVIESVSFEDGYSRLVDVIDTVTGTAPTFYAANDGFATVVDALGTVPYLSLSFAPDSETSKITNDIAIGNAFTFDGQTPIGHLVFLYDRAANVDSDELRRSIGTLVGRLFAQPNEIDIATHGRVVIISGEINTSTESPT